MEDPQQQYQQEKNQMYVENVTAKYTINSVSKEEATESELRLKEPLLEEKFFSPLRNSITKEEHNKSVDSDDIDVYKNQQKQVPKQGCWSSSKMFIKHSYVDIGRHKCHFCLAFCSVFFVVFSTLVVGTIIEKGPVIFLNLADSQEGEIDAYFTPVFYNDITPLPSEFAAFMNYSLINGTEGTSFSVTPRKVMEDVIVSKYSSGGSLPSSSDLYSSTVGLSYYQNLYLINTDYEQDIGLGSSYPYPAMGYGQCNVNSDFQDDLTIAVGSILQIETSVEQMLNIIIAQYNDYADAQGLETVTASAQSYSILRIPCQIMNLMDETYDKIPKDDFDLEILMEYDQFFSLIITYLPSSLSDNTDFVNYLQTSDQVNLNDYADQVLLMMPQPRWKWYASSSFENIEWSVTTEVNSFLDTFGFYPMVSQMFVLNQMQVYSLAIVFLQLIFNILMIIFICISVLLIYSLLQINLESKTLENGIMRMIGLSKGGLVWMIFLQCSMFVLPSVIAGFVISIPIIAVCNHAMFNAQELSSIAPLPSWQSVLEALLVGLIIPFASALIPIMNVVDTNLNDALNYDRSRTKAIYIEIMDKNRQNLVPYVTFGVLSIWYGISIFYFLPLSLVSLNLSMMLEILFLILLGIFFGLVLLAMNLQRFLEIILTYVFLFYESKSMKILVLNNLTQHKMRNMITAVIYALTIGFIIFLACSLQIILSLLKEEEYQVHGNYPYLSAGNYGNYIQPSVVDPVIQANSDLIYDFTYISYNLADIPDLQLTDVFASDNSQLNVIESEIYGVQPSIFEVTWDKFLDIYYENKTTNLSYGAQLYTARGSQSVATGTQVIQSTQTDPTDSHDFQYFFTNYETNSYQRYYRTRPIWTSNQAPIFTMTDYYSSQYTNGILLSLPMFLHYANQTMDSVCYDRLIIACYQDVTYDQQEQLIDELEMAMGSASWSVNYGLFNEPEFQQIQETLGLIFLVIGLISMFLCFFALTASMGANIVDMQKEIAILRAQGFKKSRIQHLFYYEAFIMVFASAVIGLCIGMFIAFCLMVLLTLLEEVPMFFDFPVYQLLLIFLVTIICAFISVYTPVRQILKKEIAELFKSAA